MHTDQLDIASRTADTPKNWVCYANGKFGEERDTGLSILDHGLLYGDGVFDTVVAWEGNLFRLDDHIARLFRSMRALAMAPNFSADELKALTRTALAKNGLRTAYIKWIVTRGSNNTPLMDPAGCSSNLLIVVRNYIERFHARSTHGVSLKTAAVRRTPSISLDARIKSLNYINLIMAKLEAQSAKADEALLLDVQGNVCEAPGYNVFVVSNGALFTPARDVLLGVTRASVMDMAKKDGVSARECDIGLYEIYTADEVFLTSTAGGLVPVTRVDGRIIGDGVPGPFFLKYVQKYKEILGSPDWGDPVDASN